MQQNLSLTLAKVSLRQVKGKLLTFHWRGGYLTKQVLEELLEQISEAGKERGKTPHVSLNWSQAVLRIRYTEEPAPELEPDVNMEEANEGEQE